MVKLQFFFDNEITELCDPGDPGDEIGINFHNFLPC